MLGSVTNLCLKLALAAAVAAPALLVSVEAQAWSPYGCSYGDRRPECLKPKKPLIRDHRKR